MKDQVKFETATITPLMAKRLLETNTSNRPLKPQLIDYYSAQMINGRWMAGTAEPLKISKQNILLDGQHRLHAIVKANTPITMTIATNLSHDVFVVLDQGTSRGGADVFAIAGIPSASAASAIIAFYLRAKANSWVSAAGSRRISPNDTLSEYNSRPEFWHNITLLSGRYYNDFMKVLSKSHLGGFYALFSERVDPLYAENFFNQLTSGNCTNPTITLLRTRLISDRLNNVKKTDLTVIRAIIIKTWNAYMTNSNLRVLKYDVANEAFPEIL